MRQSGRASVGLFSLHTAALHLSVSLSVCLLVSLFLFQDGRLSIWIIDYCVTAADRLFTLSLYD